MQTIGRSVGRTLKLLDVFTKPHKDPNTNTAIGGFFTIVFIVLIAVYTGYVVTESQSRPPLVSTSINQVTLQSFTMPFVCNETTGCAVLRPFPAPVTIVKFGETKMVTMTVAGIFVTSGVGVGTPSCSCACTETQFCVVTSLLTNGRCPPVNVHNYCQFGSQVVGPSIVFMVGGVLVTSLPAGNTLQYLIMTSRWNLGATHAIVEAAAGISEPLSGGVGGWFSVNQSTTGVPVGGFLVNGNAFNIESICPNLNATQDILGVGQGVLVQPFQMAFDVVESAQAASTLALLGQIGGAASSLMFLFGLLVNLYLFCRARLQAKKLVDPRVTV
jgi:hypothetical protein